MIFRVTLAALVIVAGVCPAYSKHVSSWGKGVFPDDLSWLDSFKNPKIEHSVKNEVDSEDSKYDSVVNEVNTEAYETCETPECKRVAEEFLSSINKSVDPCDDFYEFTCGAWSKKNPIPSYKATWSRFMMFANAVQHRVKGVLETKPHPSDVLPVRQAKKWYHSCMDAENLERRGAKPIESILIQAGGWPITMDENEWDSEMYTWRIVDRHYARLMGKYNLFKIEVLPDPEEEFGQILIRAPELPLRDQLPLAVRDYDEDDYDVYVALVEKAALMFVQHNAADVSKERITKEAKEIVEFEKEIYMLADGFDFDSMTLEDFYDWNDNITESNSDVKENIDWDSVLEELFGMVNIKLDPSINMISPEFQYIRDIGKLLSKTPARTIVNYIHWNFVSKMLPYTTERARDDIFAVVNEEYGVEERAPRWAECVDEMKMTHAAAYAFIDKYFTKSTETAALKMTKHIQNALENQIMMSNWLDEESKKWAKEKLSNMKMFIGYPEWYRNKTAVINRYKGLTIGAEYFDNTLSFMRYEVMKELKMIHISQDEIDMWEVIDPITVNAVYGPPINTLIVPAADFQAPLFTPEFPNNVNYATVGVIAGHEMGHGFDDTGIKFGRSSNATKLSNDVLKNYYQRAECFSDQFEGYFKGYFDEGTTEASASSVKPDEHSFKINMGLQTRGENIADSTSLQSVFEAYKEMRMTSLSAETRLPGLEEYTDDQLFFLSFGAMWCEVERPEYKKKEKEARDVHSPAKFRVIGAVSNTKNFAKAFNCPAGSPMNPSNKCDIWKKPGATIKTKHGSFSKKRNHHRWSGQWIY